MRSWAPPTVPTVIRDRFGDAPELALYDARTCRVEKTDPGAEARLYVCGITPYDATHLGHAATYLTFDLAIRAWREAGHRVRYVQNVTDVDDPLLERARQTGVDWADLAEQQIELFRGDMAALGVIPPDIYAGAVESIPMIVSLITQLQARGAAYELDGDLYLSVAAAPHFGAVSGLGRAEMLAQFAENGGDPERPGKRDPLDSLLWQRQRLGEPGWETDLGPGRPGWHVECAAIAREYLGADFDVQGGGSDLAYPHHELSAATSEAACPDEPFAKSYCYQGMVGLHGHKMSKSRGNLVLVSRLREAGVDPMVVRVALLAYHYRQDWDWTDDVVASAQQRLSRWRAAVAGGGPDAHATVAEVRAALADDLDAPRAAAAVDVWADAAANRREPTVEGAGDLVRAVVAASLGVQL